MGSNIFECKVIYDKLQDDGIMRKVTERYLANALNATEAIDIVTAEIGAYVGGSFTVDGIRKLKIEEVFMGDNAEKWYMVKVGVIFLDEKTAAEKQTTARYLVSENGFDEACRRVHIMLDSFVADWRIMSVTETNYLDYFIPETEE